MNIKLFAALLLTRVPSLATAQGYCIPQDTLGTSLLENIRRLASSSELVHVETRARAGLPLTSASNVSYVVDEAVCQMVAQAIAANVRNTPRAPSNRVRVIKAGEMYVAHDPSVQTELGIWTFYVSKAFKVTKRYGR